MNVQEISEFTSAVPVIDDGDTCGNAEHLQTAQALANRTKYLRDRTDPVYELLTGARASVPLSLASMTPDLADVPFPNESAPFNALNPPGVMGRGLARWIAFVRQFTWGASLLTKSYAIRPHGPLLGTKWDFVAVDANKACWVQLTTDAPQLWWSLPDIPPVGYLKAFTVWIGGVPGVTHAALPATKPTLSVYRQPGQTSVQIGTTVTDPSLTKEAYDAVHAITVTPDPEAIAAGQAYHVKLTGEGGAGAEASKLAVYFATVQIGFQP